MCVCVSPNRTARSDSIRQVAHLSLFQIHNMSNTYYERCICNTLQCHCFSFKRKNKNFVAQILNVYFYVSNHLLWLSWGQAVHSETSLLTKRLSPPSQTGLSWSGALDFYWWMTHGNQKQMYLCCTAEKLLPTLWLDLFDEATPFAREMQWKPLEKTKNHHFKQRNSIFPTGITADKEALDFTRYAPRKVSLR